jgi:hypothetical protein
MAGMLERRFVAAAKQRISGVSIKHKRRILPMSASEDLIRLLGPSAPGRRLDARREAAGCRARPRTTDWNAVFETIGLGGRARRV